MDNASNFTRGFTPASNPERGNNLHIGAMKWAFIYVKRAKAKNSVISIVKHNYDNIIKEFRLSIMIITVYLYRSITRPFLSVISFYLVPESTKPSHDMWLWKTPNRPIQPFALDANY